MKKATVVAAETIAACAQRGSRPNTEKREIPEEPPPPVRGGG
jgi:hypothetical protein